MATLHKRLKRTSKIIAEGDLILDPALGSLTTPPAANFNGNIALEIADHHLTLTRDEFLAHAKRCAAIVTLING